MKLSNLGLKTKKNIGNEDCYINELLEQSGQLKKFSVGCFGYGIQFCRRKVIGKQVEDGINMLKLARCSQQKAETVNMPFVRLLKSLALQWSKTISKVIVI